MREDVEKKEGRFLICLGKKSTQERERGDCSQGSSRYVSGYSRNSYSCSISPCVLNI